MTNRLIQPGCIAIAALLLVNVAGVAQQRPPSYGPQFLWGAAISAHQAEGIPGGGQLSDWYVFEYTPGNILHGETADIATDQWQRYSEDLRYASSLGLNTFRTSIAWEKVEPLQNVFNSAVIQHYRMELQSMRSMGLRPMITLLHGTTPIWFAQRGGWLANDSPNSLRLMQRTS